MPAISRPLLIALIAAVVAVLAFYATQGAREGSTDSAPPVAEPGTVQTAQAPPARRRAARRPGMPPALKRALRRRDTVVLLLRGNGSADDRATAAAVAALRGRRGVAVFSDRIGRVGRYRTLIGELGISQAPAVVIVGRGREARVVQGYIDPPTLAQDVADAR